MEKKQIKSLVGLYASAATLMAIIIPVSVLSSIAKAFPQYSIAQIQLIVSLPSLLAIFAGVGVSKVAHLYYKRTTAIASTLLFIIGGIIPYFLHNNIIYLFIAAGLVGIAMGGVQNCLGALICQCFEGDARGAWMGLVSCFVGFGGVTFTTLASRLGAVQWHKAYLAYLAIIPFLILEIIFLPKGTLEEKPTETHRIKVPKEVILLCVFGFLMFTCSQLFNSNVSMLISQKGFGGTIESGNASGIHTLSGLIGGLLVLPFKKLTKNQCLTATFIASGIGCALVVVSPSLIYVFAGAVFMSMAYAIFNPLQTQLASEACEPMGMAFNLALINATGSLGQALSPYTTAIIAKPFGGGITTMFYCGIAILVLLAVAGIIHFGKRKSALSEV